MSFRVEMGAVQHGHRDSVATRAVANLRRIVAIGSGIWRSGRNGGSSGSATVENSRSRSFQFSLFYEQKPPLSQSPWLGDDAVLGAIAFGPAIVAARQGIVI